jgi:CRP/FNR family transcriptional regulator, cyclic AMP receptor protein
MVMVCQLLVEDPELAEAVPTDLRVRAAEECIAPVARLTRGRWTGEQPDLPRDAIGLLVLEGLLIRRVGVDGRFGAELLGVGDLLRPWQGEDAEPTLPHTAGWRVLQACRVAMLDNRVAGRLSRYPQLTARLVGRALERSRNLAVQMAIVHQPRVHVRLHMLLWHLADRWGRVGVEGINLTLPLSHTMLADLVAARRPTVTVALAELEKRGLVRRVDTGLVLLGDPPGELLELRSIALPHAAGSSGIGRAAG